MKTKMIYSIIKNDRSMISWLKINRFSLVFTYMMDKRQ